MPSVPSKRRRWIVRAGAWLLVLIVLLLGALYIAGEQIAQPILKDKLQKLISQQLNARLDMGRLSYQFPYGVSVADVSLVTRGPDGGDLTLMSFKSLGLTLAKLPIGSGPLVIERIDIDRPTVHVIRTPQGFIGETSLLRSRDDRKQHASPPLSEVLQLRHVAFTQGRAEYDDRTTAGNQPLIWENLDANFDSQPIGQASHRFNFVADNGDVAKVDSAGTLDLDSLIITLQQMKITTAVHGHQPNQVLPAQVQRLLAASGISGAAAVNIHGVFPLDNIKEIDASADLSITGGQCAIPGLPEPIEDLSLAASGEYRHGKVHASVSRFECRTASIGMSAQPLSATFDRTSGRWLAEPIKAAIVYEPVDSPTRFWRQKMAISLRCALHQMDDASRVEAVLDGTTFTPQGLAGDVSVGGSFAYGDGDLNLRPTTITGLGGTATVSAMANLHTRAVAVEASADNVDLAKINVIVDPITTKEMLGQLRGQVKLTMLGSLDTVTGEGGFRVTDGRFARVPVLSAIADFLHFGQGAFVANDAFGHFKIANKKATFDRIAISTSVLRIRGQGAVGLDKSLDLKVYADSASNWQRDVKRTGIPVLSDLVGAVAGGTQSVIGGVSKQFTTMSVTGTLDKPKILPAPAPLLTDNLYRLFKAVE